MSLHSYTRVALSVERLREAEELYRRLFELEVAWREAETPDGRATLPRSATWDDAEWAGVQLGIMMLYRDGIRLALEAVDAVEAAGRLSHLGLFVDWQELRRVRETAASAGCTIVVDREQALITACDLLPAEGSRERRSTADRSWTLARETHSHNYDVWGRVTGYYQEAELGAPSPQKTFEYAGSIFQTALGARQAWQAGVSSYPTRHQGALTAGCSGGIRYPCVRRVYTPSPDETYWADFIQVKLCLIEDRASSPQAMTGAKAGEFAQILAVVDREAARAAAGACDRAPAVEVARPSFTFDGVQPLNSRLQPQATFHPGEPGVFRVSWMVRNVHTAIAVTIRWWYQRPQGGSWKTLASSDAADTASAEHSFRVFPFVAPKSFKVRRIAAQIDMLSRWSHVKYGLIYVHA
ncbi:MAG: hypothetical protein JOZ41_12755 [Chloroflexi bacterium]|nr:hypothetical protein [Chloroflexota bacterium]